MSKDPFNHPFFTDTDNYVRRQKIKYFVILTVVMLVSWGLLTIIQKNEDKKEAIVKSLLGKKAVIYSDTLMVVDYSMFNYTYQLSNGVQYNIELVKQNIVAE